MSGARARLLRRQPAQPYGYLSGARTTPTTDTGWATYSAGSRLYLPAATNYCTNPSMEVGADGVVPTGFTQSGNITGTPVYSYVAALGGTGARALRVQYTGVAGDAAGKNLGIDFWTAAASFAVGENAIGSMLVRGTTFTGVTPVVRSYAYTDADGYIGDGTSTAVAQSAAVVRYATTYASLPGTTGKVRVQLQIQNIHEGDIIDCSIDDLLIEKSAVLTPYFDGTYPNCAWSGTAHESTSARTVSSLYFTTWPSATIETIAMRVVPLGAGNDGVRIRLLTLNDAALTTSRMYLEKVAGNAWAARKIGTDANYNEVQSAALSFAAGSAHVLIQRSEATVGHSDLNYDGTSAAHVSGFDLPLEDTTNCRLIIGSNGAALQANAYIGPVIISPVRKSDAWVSAIQANSGAAYNNTHLLWNTYMSPGDLLLPLKENGYGWLK